MKQPFKSWFGYLLIAIILLIELGTFFHGRHLKAEHANLYLDNTNYQIQIGMYDIYNTPQASVVMLGDSLTFNANWNELLNRNGIINRGISNDITAGYLHRLDYVYKLKPKLCFIEGGVNDLYANYQYNEVGRNLIQIVEELQRHHIVPILQSTLCVASGWNKSSEKNQEIAALDQFLAAYAAKKGIVFLDINRLVSQNGFLRDDFTPDGIHLNAKGYALWTAEVEKVLAKYNL
jgi:lysophospholipase L1-like esterase